MRAPPGFWNCATLAGEGMSNAPNYPPGAGLTKPERGVTPLITQIEIEARLDRLAAAPAVEIGDEALGGAHEHLGRRAA